MTAIHDSNAKGGGFSRFTVSECFQSSLAGRSQWEWVPETVYVLRDQKAGREWAVARAWSRTFTDLPVMAPVHQPGSSFPGTVLLAGDKCSKYDL